MKKKSFCLMHMSDICNGLPNKEVPLPGLSVPPFHG